jgi:hypothetical protein
MVWTGVWYSVHIQLFSYQKRQVICSPRGDVGIFLSPFNLLCQAKHLFISFFIPATQSAVIPYQNYVHI